MRTMNLELKLGLGFLPRKRSQVVGRGGWLDRLDDWLWARSWWPIGCWWNGRVWRWTQWCVAWSRLPLVVGGWRGDPFQREPSKRLPGLGWVLGMVVGLRWLAVSIILQGVEG